MTEREEHKEIWLQPWCANCDDERDEWAAVESAIRADESAKAANAIYKATEALRAFAEREKELVEALEPFADFFDWSEKGAPARGVLRKTDFAKARAILSKHKEKP